MSRRKQTIAVDFDGVMHSYTSGWKGPIPTDPPVPGTRDAIARLREEYTVIVFTCRALTQDGVQGIRAWLAQHSIEVDEVTGIKPHAVLYIDDRACRFLGSWAVVMNMLQDGPPKPWMQDASSVPLVDPASWAASTPRCGTCGVEVSAVDPQGRYTACGHDIPTPPRR